MGKNPVATARRNARKMSTGKSTTVVNDEPTASVTTKSGHRAMALLNRAVPTRTKMEREAKGFTTSLPQDMQLLDPNGLDFSDSSEIERGGFYTLSTAQLNGVGLVILLYFCDLHHSLISFVAVFFSPEKSRGEASASACRFG